MFKLMCIAFHIWHNVIFQNEVYFERLLRFSRAPCIFVKVHIPRKLHPYSISAMFHGNRSSSYGTGARKFRPSVAFEWQYCPQTATIRTTEAQRWCVVGTSVAGMKAAVIGRIFDIPQGQHEVSATSRPDRANPEEVKERSLKRLYSACVQRWCAYRDVSSWCCGTFPVIANSRLSRSRANMNAWRNFTRSSTIRLCQTLTTTRWRISHFLALCNHTAHCEYQGPAAPRSCGTFWLAEQKFWFESDRKRVVLHQMIIKQCQHHGP